MRTHGSFEIFRKISNDEPTWIETCPTLDSAMERAGELASQHPADYFIFDRLNQRFVDASTASMVLNTRILVVDDHEAVRKGVCSMLEGCCGIEVVGEACNGKEAVERAWKLQPDLIIMDYTMPMMDGLTAAQIIKKRRPQTAVLLFSMHDRNEYVEMAKRHGLDGYVSKSDSSLAMLSAIEAVRNDLRYFR